MRSLWLASGCLVGCVEWMVFLWLSGWLCGMDGCSLVVWLVVWNGWLSPGYLVGCVEWMVVPRLHGCPPWSFRVSGVSCGLKVLEYLGEQYEKHTETAPIAIFVSQRILICVSLGKTAIRLDWNGIDVSLGYKLSCAKLLNI